jgi:hypothetical protein
MQLNNDIIKNINADLTNLNKEFINQEEFENTKKNKYRGKVIDNKDPLECSRVKIRVFGKYDDLDENLIPWAIPEISFIGSTKGSSIIPEIGTLVKVEFDRR